MKTLLRAALGLLAGLVLAGGALAAPAPAQPLPGHFHGAAPLVLLTHDCKDQAGNPVRRTACPLLRDGRQLFAVYAAPSFAPTGPLAGDVITLQKGSITDLASIPRLVTNVYPPNGPWAMAALFHDLCYQTKGSFAMWGRPGHLRAQPYTRAECDELLRQGMVALQVGDFQRVTIYEAVRVGGGKGWGS